MSSYECDKYLATIDNVGDVLNKYGVAIIFDVLNDTECENMFNDFWKYLENLTQKWDTPIKKNNVDSWKEYKKLYPQHSMMIQHWNIGHAQFIWNLRQNPKIVDIFAKIYGVTSEELLTSFDGASFHIPPERTGFGWLTNTSWFHTDQSYTRNNFECVQSWITSCDVNEGDATLVILESSHKNHKYFAEEFNIKEKNDWFPLSPEEVQFYKDDGYIERKIKCKKGSLVLWDSRTIHYGCEPEKTREKENFRCIAYLSYQPRKLCSRKKLEKKQKAFEDMRTTSHWPCKIKLFPKYPYTRGAELPKVTPIQKPVLSDLGKKLAGF